jgi:glycosyltransferase involved in cell wall biosynthesis
MIISEEIKVDVVVTTWQREWMTDLCLQALRANTKTPIRIIVIDNGSAKHIQTRYLHSSDIYVKLDRNYGLEYVKNLGMHFVESDYFVSLDNDILVYKYEPDWLSQIIGLLDRNAEYVAIAPRPQVLVATGMHMFETDAEIVPFGHVPGYARVMRTEWVKRMGAWSDKRPGRGHEELWIGEKAAQQGLKMGWANKIRCWHLFGKEDTDEWGYIKGVDPATHGHQPVWPMPKNDIRAIQEGVGITI